MTEQLVPAEEVEKEVLSTPLSPSISSRKDEKDQMINLNNRLAIYVNRVRLLEAENSRLQIQLTTYEETNSHEVGNMKEYFEAELREARTLLDELAKEKAELDIVVNSLHEKLNTERNRCAERNDKVKALEKKFKETNDLLTTKTLLCEAATRERDELQEHKDEIQATLSELRKELESTQRALNGETLERIDCENRLQSAKEELLFKERIYQEEINEVRRRKMVSSSGADGRVKGDYENKLESAIVDLREQQRFDIEIMKDDLEEQYDSKINDLTEQLDVVRKELLRSRESGKSWKVKVERLQDTIKLLQEQNNNLENELRDIEGEIETERQLRSSALAHVEKDRDDARDTLTQMEKDYNGLLDIKLQLDQEISVYRKLLEEEEQRLNLSPKVNSCVEKRVKSRARRKRKMADDQLGDSTSRFAKKVATDNDFGSCEKSKSESEMMQHTPSINQGQDESNNCLVM